MRVYKKHGSKGKLFEMMERVNKITLNEEIEETFDSPKEKDEKYLNKGGDMDGVDTQVNKYDDGVREPRERDIQVKDPSVEKLKGDDEPITEGPMDMIRQGIENIYKNYIQMPEEPASFKDKRPVSPSTYAGAAGYDSAISAMMQLADQIKEKYVNLTRSEGMTPEAKDLAQQYKEITGDDITSGKEINSSYIPEADDAKDENGEEEIDIDNIDVENGEEETETEIENGEEEEIVGGLADEKAPDEFNPEQILLGMEVEMEHTDDPKEALEIAMDHLVEDPEYYGEGGDNSYEEGEEESQEEAEEDADEVRDELVGVEGQEVPDTIEDDDLRVNMNWLETIKPKGVDDMLGLEEGEKKKTLD